MMRIATPSIRTAELGFPRIDWEYVLSSRRQHADVGGCSHVEVERTLTHLRSVLGVEVMVLPVLLLERLLNFAPWTYRWLGWLSESIHRVEGAIGYESLRD